MRAIITGCLLLLSTVVYGQNALIEYYDQGEELLALSPVLATNACTVLLQGKSVHPNLMLQSQKKGKAGDRQYLINTFSNRFDCRILMKEGPGEYRFTLFGSPSPGRTSVNYSGLCYFTVIVKSNIPAGFPGVELNSRVAAEAEKYEGKTVGRGECWDLAQQILDDIGADWGRPTRFGLRIDWTKEEVKAGDIMQMYSLKLVDGNRTEYFGLPQHTAIVSKALAPGVYELLHQNAGGKRYVIRGEFVLKNIQSGTLEVYRPVAGVLYPQRPTVRPLKKKKSKCRK